MALMKTIACTLATLLLALALFARADDKPAAITNDSSPNASPARELFQRPDLKGGSGQRTEVANGEVKLPLVIVKGTPYQMGYYLGQHIKEEMKAFIPPALAGIQKELGVTREQLCEVWSRTTAFADPRFCQEMLGLADGSGLPLRDLQAMHAVAILMPYSCSSIAVWGKATKDGHLYQTRNLDWSLKVGAHNFPVLVLYVPDQGIPHLNPTFAGVIGAHTGLNARGIALSEMGDASAKEAPYQVHAPHFTMVFRTLMYDADSLTKALEIFKAQPMTKRYHFVFGDGQAERRAVKIRAHSPEPADKRLLIWKDNDTTDEFAPNVLSCCVYNDEGRGAFPTLKAQYGQFDGPSLVALANQIPIKGGNCVNAVYDATALKAWISYAKDQTEAYKRPYVFVDMAEYLRKAK